MLFSDGLRLDLACRLAAELGDGCETSLAWRFAALPTVTATAKPDVSPVAGLLAAGPGLDPKVAASGTRVTADVLRRLLSENGWQVLRGDDLGDPNGIAWTELGDVDSFVHEHGWKVAHHRAAELRSLRSRIQALLAHGWRKVVVVTDHGWILLPGGLPKAELPEQLTEVRKGRCARLKAASSTTDYLTVPWRWDPGVSIAIAPGIHCFEAGTEGDHGGISPQECVTPVLTVESATATAAVEIQAMTWRGLRCQVQLSDASPDLSVDIRSKPNDPSSSLASSPARPKADGVASLIVPDEDREGQAVVVVVTGPDGKILAQQHTMVGG